MENLLILPRNNGFSTGCPCTRHFRALTYEPFPKQQILDSSKLKELADHNFKFAKNGRKLSKWVENTAGKGEIARYEQFLLVPQC